MERKSAKAWLYLLPAILFLGVFMVYPLLDVFIYSFEEGFNSASQTHQGIGTYNYSYVLHDPYFLQAVNNTFILVIEPWNKARFCCNRSRRRPSCRPP